MKYNILIKSIIFALFLFSTSYAECINIKNHNISKDLNFIEIKINNERKFLTEISRKLLNYQKMEYRGFDRKRKYKAEIIFHYLNGEKCVYPGKIRAHGDQDDHIDLIDGTPVSSLRVNLQEGNIKNVTKFILFRPKSRNSDNEIRDREFKRRN